MIPAPLQQLLAASPSPFAATKRRQRVRSATSSLDRFSASAAVSITGNVARRGTPSARRMASDLNFLSIASAEIFPFSAGTLSVIAPIPRAGQTYNITTPPLRAGSAAKLADQRCPAVELRQDLVGLGGIEADDHA